jgi:hypothetical protein
MTAVTILKERTPHGVLEALASRVCAELDATWSAVLDVEGVSVIASQGRPPATQWLAASLTEARAAGVGSDTDTGLRPIGPEGGDVGFVDLVAWDLVLAAGRPGWRFGTRERVHLVALAQLADARWADMTDRDPGVTHPGRAS